MQIGCDPVSEPRTAMMSCRFPSCVEQSPSEGATNVIPCAVRAERVSQIPSSSGPQPGPANGVGRDALPAWLTNTGSIRERSTGRGFPGSVTSVSVRLNENVAPCAFGLIVLGPATQDA